MTDGDEDRLLPASISVGDDLSACSLEELGKRISILQDEIARHQAEIATKQTSKAAAESFFKRD